MPPKPDPLLPVDDDARATARQIWKEARTAALAFTDPVTKTPFISRIGFGTTSDGAGLTLISDLAQHTAALRVTPDCALLLGEPGEKGDPLNSPRLSVRARADFVSAAAPDRAALRDCWLAGHPKARLYVDFPDFHFVRLIPIAAFLNGGFGRAYALTPDDLD
ncbi:MAG TPA: pyridoxamine 5-phosphate oxidase [Paracoccaceae bacterium]|nr:pyridoxamine 5-phosphate oxidase [Paracoccaceae bacterium]